jgi:uncharacterized protein
MSIPMLSRIEIFPIKSLDGVSLQEATVLPSGALKGDRQYAILDAQDRFVNGKANPLIHRLRATFSEDLSSVTLQIQGIEQRDTFGLVGDRTPLEAWLSGYFSQPVTVQENLVTGFPDDLNAPGPTVITVATLKSVAEWFPALDIAEVRRRFRTNLEIAATPAFWEEQLYGEPDCALKFQVGAVTFLGINPCQRCIVPTRDSRDGSADSAFVRQFTQYRKAQLPDWVNFARFNHFYKLAVNTRLAIDTQSYHLRLGNEVQ